MTLRILQGLTAAGVDAAVAAAVEAHTPGIELGYAERTSNYAVTSGGAIAGLSVTVTGQGRPVDIEFRCRGVFHTTIGTLLEATIVDGSSNIYGSAKAQTFSTADGPVIGVRSRKILTNGQSYTLTVNIAQNTAGTMTWMGSSARPMWLSVVSR